MTTLILVAYWAVIVLGGRSIRFRLSRRVQRGFVIVALVALSLNWASKPIWLGM